MIYLVKLFTKLKNNKINGHTLWRLSENEVKSDIKSTTLENSEVEIFDKNKGVTLSGKVKVETFPEGSVTLTNKEQFEIELIELFDCFNDDEIEVTIKKIN